MSATSFGAQAIAMHANYSCSKRMPFSMPARMPMCTGAAAASTSIIIGTGVVTSVSLFASVLSVLVPLLLVGLLVVLIISLSLALTGLTGLVGLKSLVGLNNELAARNTPGD